MKINGKTCEVEDIFHHYVRPKEIPILTPFCTELTGIMQVGSEFITFSYR
jgi:ERI1 exoribonuclease 3